MSDTDTHNPQTCGLYELRDIVTDVQNELHSVQIEIGKVSRTELLDSIKEVSAALSGLKIDVAVISSKLCKTDELDVRVKGLETRDSVLTGKLTVVSAVGTMLTAAIVSAVVSFLNPGSATAAKEEAARSSSVQLKAAHPSATAPQVTADPEYAAPRE